MRLLINLLITALLAVNPCLLLLSQTKAPVQTEEEKARAEIQQRLQTVKDKSQQARDLFNEAKIEADNLKMEAEKKLNYLQEAIEKARKIETINKEGLAKAVTLQKQAQELFKAFQYKKVIELVKEALMNISKTPIVSLLVSPQVFSPDGDSRNDTITLTPDIFSVTAIKRWSMAIQKQEIGEKQAIELKKWQGEGSFSDPIIWDGKVNDELVVDSASSYYAELIVVDENGAVVSSGKIKFKTDIFVLKTERGYLIDISSIIFDYNSDVVQDPYKATLKMLYDYLLRYPEYSVIVEGHTDSSGTAVKNKTLSQKRAVSVANYLIELGMDPKKIETYGLGEALPKTYESDKMGLNRRVTFILIQSDDDKYTYKAFIKKLNLDKEVKMK